MLNVFSKLISKRFLQNSLFNSSDKKYKEAKAKMWSIYKELNSNIPDYDPFELPFVNTEVTYPKAGVLKGIVSQEGIISKKDYRIFRIRYKDFGRLNIHTHYGYYEMCFIEHGRFKDLNGNIYNAGDFVVIDGFDMHSFECLNKTGQLLVMFAKEKKHVLTKNIKKYIKIINHEIK